MFKQFFVGPFLTALLVTGAASAGEQTVTLAVENMYCALCPITVRRAIEAAPGVATVEVDLATQSAVVTFDDGVGTVRELTEASASAGYPAQLVE